MEMEFHYTWPQTHGNNPVSASQVLNYRYCGVQLSATFSLLYYFLFLLNIKVHHLSSQWLPAVIFCVYVSICTICVCVCVRSHAHVQDACSGQNLMT